MENKNYPLCKYYPEYPDLLLRELKRSTFSEPYKKRIREELISFTKLGNLFYKK